MRSKHGHLVPGSRCASHGAASGNCYDINDFQCVTSAMPPAHRERLLCMDERGFLQLWEFCQELHQYIPEGVLEEDEVYTRSVRNKTQQAVVALLSWRCQRDRGHS